MSRDPFIDNKTVEKVCDMIKTKLSILVTFGCGGAVRRRSRWKENLKYFWDAGSFINQGVWVLAKTQAQIGDGICPE